MPHIYKLATAGEWQQAQQRGAFAGSADDRRDGFIHFSTAEQLVGTLAKHFAGRDDLVLAAIDPVPLGDALKWEPARDGSLFPHLYRTLQMSEVSWARPLSLDSDRRHVLPEGIERC